MDEDFDFFADLDEDAAPKRKSDEIQDEWLAALESSDIETISRTLDAIDDAMTQTWAQIAVYRDAPSQRKRWQTEEWYSRAMGAHGFYSKMFRSLDRHRTLLVERNAARQAAKELEAEKRKRLGEMKEFMLNLEVTKAKAKLATVKYEFRRSREDRGHFIDLIRRMGLLDGHDEQALWDQVNARERSGKEKQSLAEVELWRARLAEAKENLAKGCRNKENRRTAAEMFSGQ